MTPAERAIQRIRDEMHARNLSQRDLAERMHCSQGRIAKILKGSVELRVNDLEELARLVGITLVEALRDRGLEFYAELKPSEVRLLEKLRREPRTFEGLLLMFEIGTPPTTTPLLGTKKKPGRPLNSAKDAARLS